MLIGICITLILCKNILNANWNGLEDTILASVPLMFLAMLEFGIIDYTIFRLLGIME